MASSGRARRAEPPAPQRPGPEDFWAWWAATGRAACTAAIDAGTVGDLVDEISEHVASVAPGLAWELGPGETARHVLTLTAEGDPELRAPARRWLRLAPAASPTWEYADARGAGDLDVRLEVAGRGLVLDDVRVGVTRTGHRLDVVVQHPALAGLPDSDRGQVAFLALDSALGEQAVECWIGGVEHADAAVAGAVPLRELPRLVQQLREEHLDDRGEPSWVLLRGDGPEGPVVVSAQVPLAAVTAPHLDDHLSVVVPYAARTAQGFPAPAALDALRELEDHLVTRLGGSGRLVAHETTAGRRTLHFYVDATTPAAGVARAAVGAWADGVVRVEQEHDPGWRAVRAFRT